LAAQLPHCAVPEPAAARRVRGLGTRRRHVGRSVFVVGLGVWALLEAVAGVNWFRRLVGAGALVWIVAGLSGEL
jgi:hypothetical protein